MPEPDTIESDVALIADMALGDRAAQRRFLEKHGGFIRRVINRLGTDTKEYIEDLIQDVYEHLVQDNYAVLVRHQMI